MPGDKIATVTEQPPRAFSDTSSSTCVGRFTYRPDTDEWNWSDGMYRIHGFEPGEVVPTLELVMSHIHPDDREAALAAQREALTSRDPFTFPHRISTAQGDLRIVIATGRAESSDPVRLVGHLLDVTDFRRDAVETEMDQAVVQFQEHRSVIEQAKGVLMQLYSVDAGSAWGMLRAYSQGRNRKVRKIAEAVVEAATSDTTPSKVARGSVHDMLESLFANTENGEAS